MTRHPSTEGNDLEPNRVDAREDVTVPDGQGGRISLANLEEPPSGIDETTAEQIALTYSLLL